MLEPRERTLLQRALQPPDGYRVDYAIGTTFSLDLVSLLLAPLAFTLFEPEVEEGLSREDSLELLESVRRYAKRITMFCQSGRIAYPRAKYPQFAWLEQSVVQCTVPGGLFHPKVWVLRFTNGGHDPRYRVLCLSRNLTIASSWDTLLALDGEPRGSGSITVDPTPLADFVAALPGMAALRPPEATVARIAECSAELRTVSFDLPAPFAECAFRPLGIPGHTGWPFATGTGNALVVSPFVSVPALERLARARSSTILVSSPETLCELPTRPKGITSFYVLDDDAIAEMPPTADDGAGSVDDVVQLAGLHAKLYVIEDGREAEVWTGSANATDPAFSSNVEFMVQLRGPRSRVGISALMDSDKESPRLGDVLKDAANIVCKTQKSEVEKGLEARVERAREWLSSLDLVGTVTAKDERFELRIDTSVNPMPPPDGVTILAWPVLVGEARSQRITDQRPLALFQDVSLEGLSAFIAFKATARVEEEGCEARFLLNIPLAGVPPDREEKLLRSLLKDRGRLIRFLTLLLTDDGAVPEELLAPLPTSPALTGTDFSDAVPDAAGLFELLVRALDRCPERLDDIAGLVRELGSDTEGKKILPEHFESIWRPIWEARGRMS
jgi:hypothetical protein